MKAYLCSFRKTWNQNVFTKITLAYRSLTHVSNHSIITEAKMISTQHSATIIFLIYTSNTTKLGNANLHDTLGVVRMIDTTRRRANLPQTSHQKKPFIHNSHLPSSLISIASREDLPPAIVWIAGSTVLNGVRISLGIFLYPDRLSV